MDGKFPAVVSMRSFDPAMLATAIRDAHLTPCQLSGHAALSGVDRVACSGVCLDLVSLGPAMLFHGTMPERCYTMPFVMVCPGLGRSFNFASEHTAGYMGFFPPGGTLDAYTPAGLADAVLSVPVCEFLDALASYFPNMPEHVLAHGAGMRIGETGQARLWDLLLAVEEAIRDPARPLDSETARRHLESELLEAFIGALRSGCASIVSPPKVRVAGRYRKLRQARDFIAEHLRAPMHLGDLCAELGLSQRGVENLFHDFLGIGPAAFLRHKRLHGVRHALEMAAPGCGVVKEFAYAWGFWHLGRFARDYRAFFGECPSVTLARAGHS